MYIYICISVCLPLSLYLTPFLLQVVQHLTKVQCRFTDCHDLVFPHFLAATSQRRHVIRTPKISLTGPSDKGYIFMTPIDFIIFPEACGDSLQRYVTQSGILNSVYSAFLSTLYRHPTPLPPPPLRSLSVPRKRDLLPNWQRKGSNVEAEDIFHPP